MLQKQLLPSPKDINLNFSDINSDSEESIVLQEVSSSEALKFLEKAIEEGVFENNNNEDECRQE
jgi:hypothetical protein